MKLFKKILTLACIFLLSACSSFNSQPLANASKQELRVNVFPGGFNWPIWAGQEQGFFVLNGVEVKTINTPNSREQLIGLINGQFDIGMTAMDNLLAYREGQGAVPIDGSNLIAVMGADNGFLRVGAIPSVKGFNDLKGKTLSVDALTTGYAFVLLEVLERNGLLLDRDFKTVSAGGVLQRYSDLVEGKHAATMLIAPFDVLAKEKGINILSNASAALGNYQGVVAGVRKAWAENNRTAVVGYIRGYKQSLDWLYDPKNKEAAISIFMKNVNGATRQSAETSYGVLLDPREGFTRDAAINVAGVRTAVQLREKYGKPQKKMQPVESYLDTGYHREASRR